MGCVCKWPCWLVVRMLSDSAHLHALKRAVCALLDSGYSGVGVRFDSRADRFRIESLAPDIILRVTLPCTQVVVVPSKVGT